jgi:hypothetical protein
VTLRALIPFCAFLLVAGCNRAPENKEAIRRGVMEHLKKGAALDLNAVDVEVKDVKYQGNEATAQVGFKPKNAPDAGMTMNYTLERRGSEWIVKGRGAGHGDKGMMGGGMSSGGPKGEMPPGHPPTGGDAAKGSDLPPGHPPVNAPAAPAKK